jgi:transaldolase
MTTKLFADGADMNGIISSASNTRISGFTTNPTLMRQAGITNYEKFAKECIAYLSYHRPDTSLSLEVFADEYHEIVRQARKISDWGSEKNYLVYVKIPVMFTSGEPTYNLINALSAEGINLNVTAIFTKDQIDKVVGALDYDMKHIISIFAGRIADAGFDPKEMFKYANSVIDLKYNKKNIETLWASSREAYNYMEAYNVGANIITMPPDLIKKVEKFGKDLTEFSRETCQMFYQDAVKSGYSI